MIASVSLHLRRVRKDNGDDSRGLSLHDFILSATVVLHDRSEARKSLSNKHGCGTSILAMLLSEWALCNTNVLDHRLSRGCLSSVLSLFVQAFTISQAQVDRVGNIDMVQNMSRRDATQAEVPTTLSGWVREQICRSCCAHQMWAYRNARTVLRVELPR